MKKAISAGGIFVKKQNGKYYLLLLKYPRYGDLGLLKGHVEKSETLEQAALREIKEEAGLENVRIIKKIGQLTRLANEENGEQATKTIHIFLVHTDNFNHKPSEEEYDWFEYESAIKRMAFKEEAEFLKQHKSEILLETKAKVCDNKSVGMIIKRGKDILLIERKKPPFGFAPPAGHVDDKGSFANAAREEVKEEVGLNSGEIRLIAEGRKENHCRRECGTWHYWKIYQVEADGEIERSKIETKHVGWFSIDLIKSLALKTEKYLAGEISEKEWQQSPGIEPVWLEWFRKLTII